MPDAASAPRSACEQTRVTYNQTAVRRGTTLAVAAQATTVTASEVLTVGGHLKIYHQLLQAVCACTYLSKQLLMKLPKLQVPSRARWVYLCNTPCRAEAISTSQHCQRCRASSASKAPSTAAEASNYPNTVIEKLHVPLRGTRARGAPDAEQSGRRLPFSGRGRATRPDR